MGVQNIQDVIKVWKQKTVLLDELQPASGIDDYDSFYTAVTQCVECGQLIPVKASKTNGRTKFLYKKYRICDIAQKQLEDDSLKLLHPRLLKNGWLISHSEEYAKWKKELNAVSGFFADMKCDQTHVSKKERAFALFDAEKRLDDPVFYSVLIHLDISLEDLYCYETPEPLFDYIMAPSSKMTLLICENKDIWFNLRRLMMEHKASLFGIPLDGIVWGQGNKITSPQKLCDYCKTLRADNISFWYWGDIDKEGFDIYLRLKACNPSFVIRLFIPGYEEMLARVAGHTLQADQSRERKYSFEEIYSQFSSETTCRIKNTLEKGLRVPQEAVSFVVLKKNME